MRRLVTYSKILHWLLLTALLGATAGAQQSSASTPTADRYLNILTALGTKDYRRAIADSKALIIADPAFPLVYEKLISAAQRGGDLEQAQLFLAAQLAPPINNSRAHFGLGLILRERGQLAAGYEQYKQCLQAVPDFLPAYTEVVDAARSLDRLPEVEPFIHSLPQTPASKYGLGYLYYWQFNYEQGIKLSEQALQLDPHLAEAYKTIARCRYALGRYADAQQAVETLLQNISEPEKIEIKLWGLIQKGQARTAQGDLAGGLDDLLRALRGILEVGSPALEESAHAQLGYVYLSQNDCAQALHHWRTGLPLARELKSRYVVRYIANIGSSYACLGDMTEAVNYWQQALEISGNPRTLDRSILVTVLTEIANADLANFSVALPLLERALTIAGSLKNKAMEIGTLLALGALYQKHGDSSLALEKTQLALRIAQDTNLGIAEGDAWNQSGRIHFSLSHTVQAMDDHRRALAIGERTQSPQVIWQALAGIAAALEQQGELEQAAQNYRQAVKTIEDVRSRIGITEDRAGFLADKIDVYKRLIRLLVESRSAGNGQAAGAEAFHYAERARARSFLDMLAETQGDIEQDTAPDLLKQKQELQARISQLTTQLIEERSQETNKQNKAKIGEVEKGLGQADSDLGVWLRELRSRNPRFAALKYPEPISLAEAQRALDDKTVLLSYSLSEPESFLFAVSRDGFQVKRLPPQATLDAGVQKLLAAITDRNQPAPDEYRRQAFRLSKQLLEPVRSMLAGKTSLIIVADGSLHRLPFETLLVPGSTAPGELRRLPYLIRKFAVSYAPSASVLAELENEPRGNAPKGFIAFGDPVYEQRDDGVIASTLRAASSGGRLNLQPLRYSHSEIDGIAKLFADGDRELFFGAAASEENVKTPERLSQFRLVHFSTHGYVNEARPRFSGLMLSLAQSANRNPQGDDGLLSAYEIFNLKLRADLVVLSACETGLGKEVKGEGLLSLTRAFMYAGAPSVVVSLWNVNDESAADLMIRFYRNLKTGRMSKAEALRQAKLQTIDDNGFPFFWAPFVLVGEP